MPGVSGLKILKCFSWMLWGVSAKLYHSNSWEKMGRKPAETASAKTFFSSGADRAVRFFPESDLPEKKEDRFPREFS